MNRYDVDWAGYWPATPTPFTGSGELDELALAELMDVYAGHGVHGVLVNGSTGEWFSQSVDERRRVAEVAVAATAGRFPVVVGVTATTAAEASALARHAESSGADGILATVPPYVHPSPAEAVEFYREVSEATALPFMVYNWPRGVSLDLATVPGLMEELAQLPQVVAIKDSTGDWDAMVGTVQAVASEVRVFGSLTHRKGLAVMAGLGGDGAIDGGGVAAPYGVPYYEAALAGDLDLARYWVDKYAAISARLIAPDYSGRFASPIAQLKAAMHLLGQPGGRLRRPLLEVVESAALHAIAGILRDGELPVTGDREDAVVSERASW